MAGVWGLHLLAAADAAMLVGGLVLSRMLWKGYAAYDLLPHGVWTLIGHLLL
jgi:hypothetical protein